jgi:hypothetical protein
VRVIRAALSGFVFFLTLAPISNRQAHAADVSLADLRVAARSLGFLQSGSRNSGLTIGVVYAPGVSESRLLAHQTAERLRALPGPGDTGLRADAVFRPGAVGGRNFLLDLRNDGEAQMTSHSTHVPDLPGSFCTKRIDRNWLG